MSSFIHLHNHSDFSLLQASQSVQAIVDHASDLSMNAVAITEHGNLFSMIDFYKYAKKKHIKPIICCEINIIDDLSTHLKSNASHQLVLLAKNNQGYLNLMKIVSLGYLYMKGDIPIIDKNILQKYSSGLIAMSAGIKGEITYYASIGDYKTAKDKAVSLHKIFKLA